MALLPQLRGWPLEDDLAAVLAGTGAEVDHIVGRPNRFLVVLDHDDRVTEVAQTDQRGQQPPVVALVQPDGRLVQHVQHARQVRANLGGEANALPFSTRQRHRAATERQVPDADIVEEAQPIADFLEQAAGDELLPRRQRHRPEDSLGLGYGQVDVEGHRLALHANSEALGLEPVAAAGGTRSRGSIRLQLLTLGPCALVVSAAEVRDDALEVLAEGLRLALGTASAAPGLPAAEDQDVTDLLRQPSERCGRVEIEGSGQGQNRLLKGFGVGAPPGGDGSPRDRAAIVWHDSRGIEVDHRAQPLAVLAGTMGRIEREGTRRDLGHVDVAVGAGQPSGEQPVSPFERVHDHHALGQIEGDLDGLADAAIDTRLHEQPVDDDLDGVIAPTVQPDVVLERHEAAVHPDLGEAAGPQTGQLLLELALPPPNDGRQHVDPLAGLEGQHAVDDAIERLRRDGPAAARAVRYTDVGEQQPQVVVDFGDRPDGRAWIGSRRLLLDGDRGRQSLDGIDVRLLHLLEELARVRRQGFHVAALPLGVDGVEGERRLPRAGQARDHDEAIARQVDVHVLQVVNARAADGDPVVTHSVDVPGCAQTLYRNTWVRLAGSEAQGLRLGEGRRPPEAEASGLPTIRVAQAGPSGPRAQLGMPDAVGEVERQAQDQPDPEALPRLHR